MECDNQQLASELRQRIQRQVELTETSVRLADRDFVWYRVADPDQLLEAAVADDASASAAELDPFWAATWRAALGLDRFLQQINVEGVRVLELGCGSGQAGVGAAARGAMVTMTDAVELALQVAQLNAIPVAEKVTTQNLNWDDGRLDEPPFPIIIGSDLVYDPALFPMLDRCARQHLSDNGVMYLSEPFRHTGDKFSAWIVDAGWQTTEHSIDLGDNRVPIRIFQCWR